MSDYVKAFCDRHGLGYRTRPQITPRENIDLSQGKVRRMTEKLLKTHSATLSKLKEHE